VLKDDVASLDEVIVVGYGTVKKKDLTGSISSIDKKVLENNTFPDVGVAMQGQLAGVNILTGNGSPGEPVQISIRGISTLQGNAAPLIVLDEVPMPSEFNLNDLNPQNIKSIDVLKGASSAAIYGSRAASGVILITTKKGTLNSKPQIFYTQNFGVDQLTTDIEVLSAEEWKFMMFEGIRNAAIYNGFSDVNSFIQYEKFVTPGYFGEFDTNWLEEMYQPAYMNNNNLSIRGGSKNSTYNASIGYLNDRGMMRESSFERYNLNLGINTKLNDKLSIGIDFRGNISERDLATATLSDATGGRPDIRAYNVDGSLFLNTYLQNGNGRRLLIESPLAKLLDNKNSTNSQVLSASLNLQYNILEGLNFKTRYNYFNNSSSQKIYFASTTRAGSGFGFVKSGSLTDSRRQTTQTEWENSLDFTKRINSHFFNVTLATSYLKEERENTNISFDDFPDDKVQTEIYQGATYRGSSGFNNEAYLLSYISRINYKFKDRYLITGTLRRDGSSKFSKDNAFGNFPALALGWIASEESFLNSSSIDLLKLRGSIGKTGMADVGYYRWRTTYQTTDYNGQSAVIPDQTGNENLRWEATLQKDIGLDFSFFDSRIKGSINYYTKDTDGLLYPFTMAPSTGYSRATVNFAEIRNSGFDIDMNLDVLRNNNFNWSVGFNFNNNKNIVEKLDKDYITSTDGSQALSNSIIREGEPLGLIYGFKTKGIYTAQEQIDADQALNSDEDYQRDMVLGEIRYEDLNGDGYVDQSFASAIGNEDRTVLGNSLPDFSGGFNTSLRYKNWSLNIFGSYSYGNDKVWVSELFNFGTNQAQPTNVWRTALNRWTPDNPNSRYPSFRLGRTFPSREFNDFSIYDASFLKIQNVHLEYTFPTDLTKILKFINNLQIYTSVNNVYIFTNYPGPNPESYAVGDRIQGASLDFSEYPLNRTWNVGLKGNF
jgi:TonB-linked SusC/RagA family outer membrane protein